MSLTTNPNDPELTRGGDTEPTPQAKKYLVLSEAERAKGFVRPVRDAYTHVGPPGPQFPLRDLTEQEAATYQGEGYCKFETYPPGFKGSAVGRFWTQAELAHAGQGCKTVTTMARALAETYARDPHFYGFTYCVQCQRHLPIDEFVWAGTQERVGS